ncbi:MAG: response regulator transcription factor [Candidatus Aureabacteria bacterium]|nr:response regulator transcription factor [Candidatus Auribacterota bacterium]
MATLIAIVDDEPDILELVLIHLKKSGFLAEGFLEAEKFFKFLEKRIPDLIILDLMLPDTDGLDVCKFLKSKEKYSSVPIIMLTAKAEETDKIIGLELGADDYVTKPFSPKELVARVKAVLRRQKKVEGTGITTVGNQLTIDFEKYEVRIKDKTVDLTATEFKILKLLSTRKGRVFSRDEILDFLWGHEKVVIDRTIDVHIRHLREKLGSASMFIKNVRGIGYKIDE